MPTKKKRSTTSTKPRQQVSEPPAVSAGEMTAAAEKPQKKVGAGGPAKARIMTAGSGASTHPTG
ncbi:MAG: hypothetical protein JO300_15335 [Silvibacterium sp.]|nr:hypothetical protein [Silvibacterium sp.]MBV8436574.1 hypothetical protein [Silvibacterium sp.]